MLETLDGTTVGATMAGLLAFGAGVGRWLRVERLHAANTKSEITAIGIWKDLADRAMAQVDQANARAVAAEARIDELLEQTRKERQEDRSRIADLTSEVRGLKRENQRLSGQVEKLQTIVGNRRKDDPPTDNKGGPIGLVS